MVQLTATNKDIVALGSVFSDLISRIKNQQDLEALQVCSDVAESAMDAAQPYLIKVSFPVLFIYMAYFIFLGASCNSGLHW